MHSKFNFSMHNLCEEKINGNCWLTNQQIKQTDRLTDRRTPAKKQYALIL